MKKTLLLSSFLAFSLLGFAQSEQFKKGQIDFSAGVGFINTLNIALSDAGVNGTMTSKFDFPPPQISVDYGVSDQISLGGYLGYTAVKFLYYDGSLLEKDNILFIGARGLYHFELHPKFDTYAGAGLAYGATKTTAPGYWQGDPDMKAMSGDLYYQLTLGGRYRFTPNTGVFVELGYGMTVLNLGLNLKF